MIDIIFLNFFVITFSYNVSLTFINKLKWFINTFVVSETFCFYIDMRNTSLNFLRKINSYFNRIVFKFNINFNILIEILDKWTTKVKFILKLLIFLKATKHKVLCLLYHYRHLNEINLIDFSFIDFITHKIRIILKIKLTLNFT